MVDGDGLIVIITIAFVVGVFFGVSIREMFEKGTAKRTENWKCHPGKVIEKIVSTKQIEAIALGEKRFELFKDTDNIQIGDTIIFREFDENAKGDTVENMPVEVREIGKNFVKTCDIQRRDRLILLCMIALGISNIFMLTN